MGEKLWRRPSPALIVSMLALVLAASGTAVAASKLVSGDSLIKVNSLSGNRLKTGSVTGKQVKASTLGTVPSAVTARTAVTAGTATTARTATTAQMATTAQTATTATTAQTATTALSSPISKVTYVAATGTAASSSAATVVTAACPAGTTVIGGGASLANEFDAAVNDSYPNGKSGWTADVYTNGASVGVTVTAICAPAASTAP